MMFPFQMTKEKLLNDSRQFDLSHCRKRVKLTQVKNLKIKNVEIHGKM